MRLGVRPDGDLVGAAGALHLGNVAFELVEIDAQRRRIEVPLRDAGAVRRDRHDFFRRVAFGACRNPDVRRSGCGRANAATLIVGDNERDNDRDEQCRQRNMRHNP